MTFSLCLADETPIAKPLAQSLELRTEHEEKRDSDGKVNAHVDTVYRGNVRILVTHKLLTKSKYGTRLIRAYFAEGKDVMDEIHYDDGTQVIRLYKDDILCEMFRRKIDGSVEPVSSEELAKLKAQQQELMETLKK
jgi:hypothetical protein